MTAGDGVGLIREGLSEEVTFQLRPDCEKQQPWEDGGRPFSAERTARAKARVQQEPGK